MTIEERLKTYRSCREKMDSGACGMICEECDDNIAADEFICFHRLEAMVEGAVVAKRDETRLITGCGDGHKFTSCKACVREYDPSRCKSWRAGTGFTLTRKEVIV